MGLPRLTPFQGPQQLDAEMDGLFLHRVAPRANNRDYECNDMNEFTAPCVEMVACS